MSITNGQTILSTDLLAMDATATTNLALNNLFKPTQMNINFFFPNVVVSSSARNTQAIFIPPDDYFLNDVAISTGGTDGTITVTIDNGAMIEPISMTATVGGSSVFLTKFPRYYGTGSTATAKPVQVLLKDSQVIITITNTDITTTHNIVITLCCDSRYRRF